MALRAPSLLLAATLLGPLASGEEAGGGPDITRLRMDKQIQGSPVNLQGLSGKVVIVEFWGLG